MAVRGISELLCWSEGRLCRQTADATPASARLHAETIKAASGQLRRHTTAEWSDPEGIVDAAKGLRSILRHCGTEAATPPMLKGNVVLALVYRATSYRIDATPLLELLAELADPLADDDYGSETDSLCDIAEHVSNLAVYAKARRSDDSPAARKLSSLALSFLAAAASRDKERRGNEGKKSELAASMANAGLLPLLLRQVSELSPGGRHPLAPTMRLLSGVAAVMESNDRAAADVVSLPVALSTAQAVTALLRSAAASPLEWCPSRACSAVASCPTACVDALLVLHRLLVAAHAPARAADGSVDAQTAAGSVVGGRVDIGGKRPRSSASGAADTDGSAAASSGAVDGDEREERGSSHHHKRQLVSVSDGEATWRVGPSGLMAEAHQSAASAGAQFGPHAIQRRFSVLSDALCSALDAVAALFLQHAGWAHWGEPSLATDLLSCRYACAGGNTLASTADAPVDVTPDHLEAARQALQQILLIDNLIPAGVTGPSASVAAPTSAIALLRQQFAAVLRGDGSAGRVISARQLVRVLFTAVSAAPAASRVDPTALCEPVAGAGAGAGAGAEDGAVAAAPACSHHAAGSESVAVGAVRGMACVVLEEHLRNCDADALAAAMMEGAGELILELAQRLPVPLLRYAAHAARAVLLRATATSFGSSKGVVSLAELRAGAALVPLLPSLPGAAVRACVQALAVVVRRGQLSEADGTALSAPFVELCAHAAVVAAKGLELAAEHRLPGSADALADGTAVAFLLQTAGHAARSLVYGATDGGLGYAAAVGDSKKLIDVTGSSAALNLEASPDSRRGQSVVDAVLSLTAATWPQLTAEGRACVDAVLDDRRMTDIMMRNAASAAALRFHVALCCPDSDTVAAAGKASASPGRLRIDRAVKHWALLPQLAHCFAASPAGAKLGAGDLAAAILSGHGNPGSAASLTAADTEPFVGETRERAALALRLLHAAIVSAPAGSARSRALQFLRAPPPPPTVDGGSTDSLQLALRASKAFAVRAHGASYTLAAKVKRLRQSGSADEAGATRSWAAEPLRYVACGGEWDDRKYAKRSDYWCFSGGEIDLKNLGSPPDKADALLTAAAGSAMSTDDCIAAVDSVEGGGCSSALPGESRDPLSWYRDIWPVMHDDERDEQLLQDLGRGNGVPAAVGAMPLLRFLAAEAVTTPTGTTVAEAAAGVEGSALSTIRLGAAVLPALLAHPVQFFAVVRSRAPAAIEALADVAAAVLAERQRAGVVAVFLPVLAAAASHLPAAASTDGRFLPMVLHADALAAMSAVVRAAEDDSAGFGMDVDREGAGAGAAAGAAVAGEELGRGVRAAAVQHCAAFLAALGNGHAGNNDAAHEVLAHLQADGLLADVVAAARSAPDDRVLLFRLCIIMQWLGSLDGRRATAAAAVMSAAGAVEFLAEALLAAEERSDSLVPEAAPADVPIMLRALQQLVGAARAVASGSLAPQLMATGVAGSLMRLATLAVPAVHEATWRDMVRNPAEQALSFLKPQASSDGAKAPARAGSAHAQAVRLAVAARAHTWRRRRHAVAAWVGGLE